MREGQRLYSKQAKNKLHEAEAQMLSIREGLVKFLKWTLRHLNITVVKCPGRNPPVRLRGFDRVMQLLLLFLAMYIYSVLQAISESQLLDKINHIHT